MMPPYNQSVVGKAQLRKAYEAGSKMRALSLKFTVDEIVEISPEWAFVRTKSSGSSKVLSTGVTNVEANQELFILRKSDDGAWKIARYNFSNTKPSP
jgi:ketosteroid isomerase-like protein